MALGNNAGLGSPVGVPSGGTTGQVLKKTSDANFDLEWGAGGSGSGTVESVSVTANDGITQSVSDPTINPNITLGLGDITPDSVNTPGAVTAASLTVNGVSIAAGIPSGGSQYQILQKNSATNYDVGWTTADFIPGKTVANYSALPAPATAAGQLAICLASQGVWPLASYKAAGLYYCDGVNWTYEGDYTLTNDASQIINTPAGNITATNVQSALNQLDSIKAGTGFTTATTAGTAIVGTLGTNGISMGIPAFITTAGGAGVGLNTAQTNVTWTVNTSGISINAAGYAGTGYTSTTQAGATVGLTNNSNGLSIAYPVFLTTGRASTDAVGLNTAQTNVTWTVNSGGISLNAGGYAGTGFTSTTTAGTAIVATNNNSGLSLAFPTIITNAITTARASNDGIGLNTALTAGPLAMTINSSGLSLNASSVAGTTSGFTGGASISGSMTHNTAGLALSLSHPAWITTAAQSNQVVNALIAGTATNAATNQSSSLIGSMSLSNLNGMSFYTTASGAISGIAASYTVPTQSVQPAVGLNTAQTNVTWTVNSSGISINAAGYAGTGFTLNVTNLSTSATLNSNGLNLSINNVDDHVKGFQLYGNTAGTSASTYTTTQPIYLQGGNGITLSGNSNSIIISAQNPGGTTFWTNSYFQWPQGIQYVGTSSLTMGNSSMYMQPFQIQNVISASYIRHLVSIPAFGSSTQATAASTVTADWYATFYANIFSQGVGGNSKSLQLLSQATAGMTNRWMWSISNAGGNQSIVWQMTYPKEGANTNNSGQSYSITSANINWSTTGPQTNFTGIRWLDIPFAQSLAPGQYWMQFQRSTSSATTGGNFANTTGLTTNMTVFNITQASINPGQFGAAIGSTDALQLGLGVYTTNSSGGTANSVPLNAISTIANQPVIPFQIIRQA